MSHMNRMCSLNTDEEKQLKPSLHRPAAPSSGARRWDEACTTPAHLEGPGHVT